jgi:type II secretory pathway pseudopilin PulG
MFYYRKTKSKKTSGLSHRAQGGFTFLEIVISLLVLSAGGLTMLQAVNVAMDANYRAQQEVVASNLASALLSEIMSKSFESSTNAPIQIDGSEVRTDPAGTNSYDDVDDYHQLELIEGSTPETVGGLHLDGTYGGTGFDLPNCQGFTRAVSVIFVDQNNVPTGGTVSDYKRITVTLSGPGVNNFQLEAIRSLF